MSLLAALTRAYDRLPDAPPYGFSSEKIGFCVVLNPDGSVADVVDLRDTDRKRSPRMMFVPQAVKRTVGIAPNFLWDKTAYVLGVTAGEGKRTAEEHATFRARHLEWLQGHDDEGLLALTRFLQSWTTEHFAPPLWTDDLRDQNLVFALVSEYRSRYLHDRPAAREAWQQIAAAGASDPQICLVSGSSGPVARLHPSVKGVWGAQSSGAALSILDSGSFRFGGFLEPRSAKKLRKFLAMLRTKTPSGYEGCQKHRLWFKLPLASEAVSKLRFVFGFMSCH